jgi:hypothetical protein
VAVVGKLEKKMGKRQLYTKGETIQKHRLHRIEKQTNRTRKPTSWDRKILRV